MRKFTIITATGVTVSVEADSYKTYLDKDDYQTLVLWLKGEVIGTYYAIQGFQMSQKFKELKCV